MRLAIDARFGSIMGGLGTYTRGLVPGLISTLQNAHSIVLIVRSTEEQWLSELRHENRCTIVEASQPYSMREQIILPYLLHQYHIDLLLTLHPITPLLCPCATIVTVHDTILHRYRNGVSAFRHWVFRWMFERSVRRSSSVITISHATTNDLLSEIPTLDRDRIAVVYPGADEQYAPTQEIFINDEKPYVLYVGNAKEHKNVQTLIDACIDLPLRLVLLTGGKEVSSLRMVKNNLRLEPSSSVPLQSLLKNAAALITATHAEGFCLPIIEALRVGTPVIASDLPVLQEVSGGCAHLIEPTIPAFRGALTTLLQESLEHDADAGRRQAMKYTWARSVTAHAATIRSLLEPWTN